MYIICQWKILDQIYQHVQSTVAGKNPDKNDRANGAMGRKVCKWKESR